jgi:hypothetical protein
MSAQSAQGTPKHLELSVRAAIEGRSFCVARRGGRDSGGCIFSATPPRAPHSTPLREHESTGLVPVSVRTLPHAVTRSTQVSAKDVCQPMGRDIFRNIEVRHLYPDVKPSYCRTDNDYIIETGYHWRSLYCVRGTISTPHTICLIAG